MTVENADYKIIHYDYIQCMFKGKRSKRNKQKKYSSDSRSGDKEVHVFQKLFIALFLTKKKNDPFLTHYILEPLLT